MTSALDRPSPVIIKLPPGPTLLLATRGRNMPILRIPPSPEAPTQPREAETAPA
eukprot:CAMPEP_0180249154 /NCGR_PEP_ID=MMETSP0987-20121128/37142_1 /TAXON_ID=697907 /ORGANISM="non described non described, Strain CCMP2293" /LENGTH=53 /DNA_ID=CAMNT_0022217389 /DNA_START=95 /DNA_END=252 /DNA_ORIENTATION=-